jgi:uncharacterized membrane protein
MYKLLKNKKNWWSTLLIVYICFFYLMLQITLQYVPIKTDVAFLRIKQSYTPLLHYRILFFTHVFSAIFALIAGFSQFSKWFLKKYPAWHRKLGWLYVSVIILLAAPSGFGIGLYANGGLSSRLAFCLLAVLWILFTVIAVYYAIKKQFAKHKQWMWRSFTLTLSAITLRAWKFILVALFHPKPMDVYQLVAWLGWVLNLVLVECWILYTFKYAKK